MANPAVFLAIQRVSPQIDSRISALPSLAAEQSPPGPAKKLVMYDAKGIVYRIWSASWRCGVSQLVTRRKGEFALEVPDKDGPYYRDWLLNLYGNTRRVIATGSGEVFTIGIGYASTLLAILIAAMSLLASWTPSTVGGWSLWGGIALLMLTPFLTLPIVVFYSAFLALRALPPADYAKVVLAGRSPADAICITAYEIKTVCEQFLSAIESVDFVPGNRSLELLAGPKRPNDVQAKAAQRFIHEKSSSIEKWASSYEVKLVQIRDELSRVYEMKVLLSDQLGIPRRKLCDHILRYSPNLQVELSEKFAANWRTLADRASKPSSLTVRLVREVARVTRKARDSAERQRDLLKHKDLLPTVHGLASLHSTSGAAMQYADSLSQVAKECETELLEIQKGDWKLSEKHIERLLFLLKLQRAYPGIEPHETCLSILKEGGGRIERELKSASGGRKAYLETKAILIRKQTGALQALGRTLKLGLGGEEAVAHLAGELQSQTDDGRAISFAINMRQLKGTIAVHIDEAKGDVADKLGEFAESFFNGALSRTVITSGYSKTVREAIRPAVFDGAEKPRVFVATDRVDNDPDTSRMVYELTEQTSGFAVGRGSGHALARLLSKGDPVLVLHGVECFDDQGRVIHAQLGGEGLDGVKKELDTRGCRSAVVFIAEGYKRRPDILGQSHLFRFHMDRLAVYEATYVITDDGLSEFAKE